MDVLNITMQEAHAARMAALEVENARLRGILGRAYDYTWHRPDCSGCDGAAWCDCGLTALDAEIESFLEGAG
jgi:hypothetical protein